MPVFQILRSTSLVLVLALLLAALGQVVTVSASQAAPAPAFAAVHLTAGFSQGGNVPGPFVVGASEGGNLG